MPANGSIPPQPSADPSVSSLAADSLDRRTSERFEVTWSVDCRTAETFLYASIRNISEMGIFVFTLDPLPIGTTITLRFAPLDPGEPFVLRGRVQWVNAVKPLAENLNPGMGVRFLDLTLEARERLVEAIHTIAYVRDVVVS
jgi:type IV pilus assembly protein PilZ